MMRLVARSILPAALLVLAIPAGSQEVAPAVSPSSLFTGDYLLQVVGSFVVVIVLLVAVLVMLKRFNGVNTSMGGDMRVVSSVGVGQRERAVLLQVGEQQVLLGVGPGNVRTLRFRRACRLGNVVRNPSFFRCLESRHRQSGGRAVKASTVFKNTECCASTVGASDS